MKILFHANGLNFRGTTVAITDYARYNQEILGNESVIGYNSSLVNETDSLVLGNLQKEFDVVSHNGNNIETVIDQHKIDLAYFIRAGNREFLPTNCKTAVHAVFQLYEPHGDRYAYISEWLANRMQPGAEFVPHIVQLPDPMGDLRSNLGIGKDVTVIGRYGGLDTFDLPFVHHTISNLLSQRNDYVFLFMGTRKWIDHPRVIFLQETQNLQFKSNFINACDAMIHARSNGESFGLSIAEFLSQNKPVMAWANGDDRNHTVMLANSGLLYNDANDLAHMLRNFKDNKQDWACRVDQFKPDPVMNKFKKVFL